MIGGQFTAAFCAAVYTARVIGDFEAPPWVSHGAAIDRFSTDRKIS